jgi:hypothetical protein
MLATERSFRERQELSRMDSRLCYPDLRCLPDSASGQYPRRIPLLHRTPKELRSHSLPVSVPRKIFETLAQTPPSEGFYHSWKGYSKARKRYMPSSSGPFVLVVEKISYGCRSSFRTGDAPETAENRRPRGRIGWSGMSCRAAS